MEFTNYTCPVCGKPFLKDDDIVVCPECGTPHHRECYEKNGKCFYADKHKDGFSFENQEQQNDNSTTIICPNCKTENPKELFYCQKCGFPLNEKDRNKTEFNQNNQTNSQNNIPPFGMPFGANQQVNNMFDPMAGLKNDEPLTDNINAGEMSKFIGKNTQYFLRIFSNIKNNNKSRFNFMAFILSGIYFLYRKMYVLGIIFSFLLIGLTVASTMITLNPDYQAIYQTVLENSKNATGMFGVSNYSTLVNGLSQNEIMMFLLPTILQILKYVLMIISGLIANRTYWKHCVKSIDKIKSNNDNCNINKTLETKGGVNLAVSVCFGVAYLAVIYIPLFIH